MKSRKNKEQVQDPAEISTGGAVAPKPRPMSLAQAVTAGFEANVSARFPVEFNEPEDRQILQAVWMLASRWTVAHLGQSTLGPLDAEAKRQFELIVPPVQP